MGRASAILAWLFATSFFLPASGNTEKTIFIAPEAVSLPDDASIDNLYLSPLNTNHPSIRTYVNASFPNAEHPKGLETWFLLQDLSPGQRYEVRICWLATQPTSFWLYTYTLSEAFEDANLLSSLSQYAHTRRSLLSQAELQHLQTRYQANTPEKSLLFLQVFAAADYFTLNKTLMEQVPPVFVDVILDPFLFNIFPQSLLPTGGYIVVLAIAAWFISAFVVKFLQHLTDRTPASPSPARKPVKKTQ